MTVPLNTLLLLASDLHNSAPLFLKVFEPSIHR